jgi:putative membrane protein
VYELFEWAYAIMADPEAGIAILGSQWDIRDAQKDMLMDTIGALVGVGVYTIRKK